MILLHWTPARNVRRIMYEGLRPKHAQGKIKAIWLVEHHWALDVLFHLCEHHRIRPWQFRLLEVTIPGQCVILARGGGRFYTLSLISPGGLRICGDWPPAWAVDPAELEDSRHESTHPSCSRTVRQRSAHVRKAA